MPPKGKGEKKSWTYWRHARHNSAMFGTCSTFKSFIQNIINHKSFTPQIHITVHYLRYWWLSKVIVISGLKSNDRMSQILEDIKPEESRFCSPGTWISPSDAKRLSEMDWQNVLRNTGKFWKFTPTYRLFLQSNAKCGLYFYLYFVLFYRQLFTIFISIENGT